MNYNVKEFMIKKEDPMNWCVCKQDNRCKL
jgi:hypothetical protein